MKKILIVCLIILGLVDIYFLASTAKEKYDRSMASKPQYKDNRLEGYVALNNMDDIFNVIKDRTSCLSVISALRYDTRYINFILEDVPKAKTTDTYYKANEEAIKDIFGFTSSDEFKDFYDTIKPLQHMDSYDVLTDTINISSDKYTFNIQMHGDQDIIIPITINVTDAKNMKSTSFWNMG
ncbi:hypothetical protein [uncultured Clostridium sp.]|uniref:hypothetical protein n=1 Tax=uncultured Clostridium sp. TaxID=59620 RepID=UPI0028E710BD|nr:hypothetical protein [uncultured Clostridium sp.]